jgi:hypothetical protein
MFSWWICLEHTMLGEFEGLQIVWKEKSWLLCVYTNTHSISLLDLFPNGIWNELMKTSYFSRDICSNKLQTQYMERLEMNIVHIIYKLEMIFHLLFSNSMEHLPLHLSFEDKVEGLVQYRWMYIFEMLMDVYIRDVRVYTYIVIKILLSFFVYFKTFI